MSNRNGTPNSDSVRMNTMSIPDNMAGDVRGNKMFIITVLFLSKIRPLSSREASTRDIPPSTTNIMMGKKEKPRTMAPPKTLYMKPDTISTVRMGMPERRLFRMPVFPSKLAQARP